MNSNQFYLTEDLSCTKLSQALLSLGKKIFGGQGESKSLAFSTERVYPYMRIHVITVTLSAGTLNSTPRPSHPHPTKISTQNMSIRRM